MKKYIRTKDGIWKYNQKKNSAERPNEEFKCNQIWLNIEEKDIIKKADTIEELCDEFVFEDMDGHYLCDFCEQTDIDVGSKFDELKYWFNHSKEQQYKTRNCYGAIWTDKGLIYVAKMNDKGELELL